MWRVRLVGLQKGLRGGTQRQVVRGAAIGNVGLRDYNTLHTPTTHAQHDSLSIPLQNPLPPLLHHAPSPLHKKNSNGVGKSTLLHVLGGRTLVGFPAWLSCMHVEQEAEASSTTSAVQAVVEADARATQLQRWGRELFIVFVAVCIWCVVWGVCPH